MRRDTLSGPHATLQTDALATLDRTIMGNLHWIKQIIQTCIWKAVCTYERFSTDSSFDQPLPAPRLLARLGHGMQKGVGTNECGVSCKANAHTWY